MKKWKSILCNNFYMLRFIIKHTPSYIFVVILDCMINGILYTSLTILFMKRLVDQIQFNTSNFSSVALLFVVVVSLHIIITLFYTWKNRYFEPKVINKLKQNMHMALYKKATQIDIECYENPEFYNNFVWAINESDNRALSVVRSFSNILLSLFSLVTALAIIIQFDWFTLILVVISVVITYIMNNIIMKANFIKTEKLNKTNRKIDYVNRVFYLDTYAKEIRLFDSIKQFLFKKYDDNTKELKNITIKYNKRNLFYNLISSLSSDLLLGVLFVIVLVYKITVAKTITVGTMITMQTAAGTLLNNSFMLINSVLSIKENDLYINKFRGFCEYEAKVKDDAQSVKLNGPINILELNDVSFSYDGINKVLNNISLNVRKNEKIALVGYNGAGKTTLIKLILRLYDPNKGEIAVNGKNIKSYTIDSYRDRFSTVFQDFKLFSLPLSENILGDIYDESKETTVMTALKDANFENRLNKMPSGISTILTREFSDEGVILSGGEAQKAAISRAFAKDGEIIVMDEASSALDPDSEYELNELMFNKFRDKTVIIISHRLATTRMADRIYMMDQGEIIESGSHSKLMRERGKYYELFSLQSERYQSSKVNDNAY